MHAAVVTSFDAPPDYRDYPEPVARGRDEMVVDVLAAALHPRVRSQAEGSHGEVIAAGRDTARLAALSALGADSTCAFDELVRDALTAPAHAAT